MVDPLSAYAMLSYGGTPLIQLQQAQFMLQYKGHYDVLYVQMHNYGNEIFDEWLTWMKNE